MLQNAIPLENFASVDLDNSVGIIIPPDDAAGTFVNATGESTATDDAVITSATSDGCASGTSMPAPVNTAEAKDDAAGTHVASQGW